MDHGWYVTVKLQRRFHESPFDEPFNPGTNLRVNRDPDGWTFGYDLDSTIDNTLPSLEFPHEPIPSPQTITDLMGDKDFWEFCFTHTPILRWGRTGDSEGYLRDLRSNPA